MVPTADAGIPKKYSWLEASFEPSAVNGSINNEEENAKKQSDGLCGMLLSTLDASLLGNMVAGKDFTQAGDRATSPKGQEAFIASEKERQ